MLIITEDATSGVHDTLIAACDRFRYAELGVQGALEGNHRSCADNLDEALSALGMCSFLCGGSVLNLGDEFVVDVIVGAGRWGRRPQVKRDN